jgi:uncharacterized membrane protein YfcA
MDGLTLALVATGVAVGAVSGMLGIGGAVVLVPALMFGFGFSQARAQGTSIGALIPPIGIFAAIQYYRHGNLDVRAATFIAFGFVFGALGGATLVTHVPQAVLRRIFATLLVYVAAQLVFANPQRKMGAVIPGVAAMGALWAAYFVRKAAGRRPPPPPPRPPAPPPQPDIEYYI